MNVPSEASRPETSPSRLPIWVLPLVLMLLIPVTLFAGLAAVVMTSFGLAGDSREVRNVVMQSSADAQWKPTFEARVGVLPVILARTIVGFLDVEPEVKLGLRAFRGADVGVYELRSGKPDAARLMETVDQRMMARDLECMVRVLDGDEAVAVYVPRDMDSARRVEGTVLVISDQQMVITTVRGNLEPLLEIARRHLPRDVLASHCRAGRASDRPDLRDHDYTHVD
jgi:hypothetical protein